MNSIHTLILLSLSIANSQLCSDGDVQLIDLYYSNMYDNEGYVQICFYNQWNSVCGETYLSRVWGELEINVTCSQLGYDFGIGLSEQYYSSEAYSFECAGNELSLFECHYSITYSCNSNARIKCLNGIECNDSDIYVSYDSLTSTEIYVCINGLLGSLCVENWSIKNTAVLCHQIGYNETFLLGKTNILFNESDILYHNISCEGSENDMNECKYFGFHDCLTERTFDQFMITCKGLKCNDGDARLVDGSTKHSGRVETCLHGLWVPVCNDGWNETDASILCKQLGFDGLYMTLRVSSRKSSGYHMGNVDCTGKETILTMCSHSILSTCTDHEAGVICNGSLDWACNEAELRLIEGSTPADGRVEMCLYGVWGSVCNYLNWGYRDAKLVCRNLGYDGRYIAVLNDQKIYNSSLFLYYGGASCIGRETISDECWYYIENYVCEPIGNEVGVKCDYRECNETDIRLIDGNTQAEGRIEICLNGWWGSVVDRKWDYRDANVACRQLGYNGPSIPIQRFIYNGNSSILYQLTLIHCIGHEQKLSECHNLESYGPVINYRAEVACKSSLSRICNDTDIRLVGGDTQASGVVEICLSGWWGSICDNGWDYRDATVVCRQLGYDGPSIPIQQYSVVANKISPFYNLNYVCTGDEERLINCSFGGHGCSSLNEAAGVMCKERSEKVCNENDVRISGGDTPDDGQVQTCLGGWWGSICTNWRYIEANVICRQLGYDGLSTPKALAPANGLYHLGYVYCYDYNRNLKECQTRVSSTGKCYSTQAGVSCKRRECNEADVRLVDGVTSDDGFIQLCLDGGWTLICDSNWNHNDAAVVCRQLSYNGSIYPLTSQSKPTSPPYIISNVRCEGSEEFLINCTSRNFDYGLHHCTAPVRVSCTEKVVCSEMSVKLIDKDGESKGVLQYCYNGRWNSVCADEWSSTGKEVEIMCKTLGYMLPGQQPVLVNYGKIKTGSIIPFDISCKPGATSLEDCDKARRNINDCSRIVGIDCKAPCNSYGITTCSGCAPCFHSYSDCSSCALPSSDCSCQHECYTSGTCCSDVSTLASCSVNECQHGDIRLTGGVLKSMGRVEFCVHGLWGEICINNNMPLSNERISAVICRQLEFVSDDDLLLEISYKFPVVGEISCYGNETNLLQCSHKIGKHNCTANDYTSNILRCFDEVPCNDGNVRLNGGLYSSDGGVEYCKNKVWGKICSDEWSNKEARVVCRQLDFDLDDARTFPLLWTEISFRFLVTVTCIGSEVSIEECQSSILRSGGCRQATVSCMTPKNITSCSASQGLQDPFVLINKSEANKVFEKSYGSSIDYWYGECSVYVSKTEVCEGILRPRIDRVYVQTAYEGQHNISQILNSRINKEFRNIIVTTNRTCIDEVYKLLCHFYLPHCGNATHPALPSSICMEDCQHIKTNCQQTWKTVLFALSGVDPVINCDEMSAMIEPLPHCCSKAVEIHQTSNVTDMDISVLVQSPTPSAEAGVTQDSVIVDLVAILLVVSSTLIICSVIVIIAAVYVRKKKKTKAVERLELDTILEMHRISKDKHSAGYTKHNAYRDPSYEISSFQRTRISSFQMRQLVTDKLTIESKNISLICYVGEGEFGIVYKARLETYNDFVAVKTLKGEFNKTEVDRFVEESLKMSRFKHSHVMSLIGVCLDSGSAPYIIMPYMANGSLLKYLRKDRNNIVIISDTDEDELRDVCKRLMVMCSQIASGMEYLAAEKYVHRDLAARNCMIDAHFLIKITDFGLSEDVYERNYFRQESTSGEVVRLPIKWMAPESLSDGHFSEKSDVWSYGVTMWEIFSGGKAPYPGTDPLTLVSSLEKGHRMPQPYNSACNEEIYGMMRQCWEMSPEDRPSFKEICSTVSQYIEHLAGYLEIGYNPFTIGGMKGEKEGLEDGSKKELVGFDGDKNDSCY